MSSPIPPKSPISPAGSVTSSPDISSPSEKGSFSGRKVRQNQPSGNQIPEHQNHGKAQKKGLFQRIAQHFASAPSSPDHKYHATINSGGQTTHIYTNDPNINVWTPGGGRSTVHTNAPHTYHHQYNAVPHMGMADQMHIPGLGVLKFDQPIFQNLNFGQLNAWQPPFQQISTPSQAWLQPEPQGWHAHRPAHPHASGWHSPHHRQAASPSPHQPDRQAVKYKHMYDDLAAVNKALKNRVSERFHPEQSPTKVLDQRIQKEKATILEHPLDAQGKIAKQKSRLLEGIQQSTSRYESLITYHLPHKHAEVQEWGKRHINAIEEGMHKIDHILRKESRLFSTEEITELKKIRQELNSERLLQLQVMSPKNSATLGLGSDMTWQGALEFMRVGYPLNPSITQHFEKEPKEMLLQEAKVYGSGLSHNVIKLNYKTWDGEPVEKLFKAEDARDSSGFQSVAKDGTYIDTQAPRFALRNLATSKLHPLICQDCKVPKMGLSTYQGQLGLVMDIAKGHKPYPIAENGGVTASLKTDPAFATEVAKGLVETEWFDLLCGQQDRHAGNYLIDKEGKVTLIDNDQSFHPGNTDTLFSNVRSADGRWVSPWPGEPVLIDRQTYNKLKSLTAADIREKLTGLLPTAEIEATIERLNKLKFRAEGLARTNRIVDNWNTWKSSEETGSLSATDYLKQHGKPQSYFTTLSKLDAQVKAAPAQSATTTTSTQKPSPSTTGVKSAPSAASESPQPVAPKPVKPKSPEKALKTGSVPVAPPPPKLPDELKPKPRSI